MWPDEFRPISVTLMKFAASFVNVTETDVTEIGVQGRRLIL